MAMPRPADSANRGLERRSSDMRIRSNGVSDNGHMQPEPDEILPVYHNIDQQYMPSASFGKCRPVYYKEFHIF